MSHNVVRTPSRRWHVDPIVSLEQALFLPAWVIRAMVAGSGKMGSVNRK
jgi:hypothetical protein